MQFLQFFACFSLDEWIQFLECERAPFHHYLALLFFFFGFLYLPSPVAFTSHYFRSWSSGGGVSSGGIISWSGLLRIISPHPGAIDVRQSLMCVSHSRASCASRVSCVSSACLMCLLCACSCVRVTRVTRASSGHASLAPSSLQPVDPPKPERSPRASVEGKRSPPALVPQEVMRGWVQLDTGEEAVDVRLRVNIEARFSLPWAE